MELQLRSLTKRYGETEALRGLDLTVRSDEVCGIAGPNGAGKSTMVRILGGEEEPDSGTILLDGVERSVDQLRNQVAVVHQEPQLFGNLTVAENLLIGRSPDGAWRPRPTGDDLEVLDTLGIGAYANRPLVSCSLVVWQLTEIGRALRRDASIFLFDEPNSALTAEESERLFHHMMQLRAEGHILLLVSHRLQELVDVSDRVALIREGRCATVLSGDSLTEEALARELVMGLDVRQDAGVSDHSDETLTLLEVAGWSHPRGAFRDVAFELGEGRVLALMGVEGSGGRELLRSLAAMEPGTGTRRVIGTRGIGAGSVSYLPADRRVSLFGNLSVGANLVARLGRLQIASRSGRLRRREMDDLGTSMMCTYDVRAQSHSQPISSLSGGNQQKVALASAVATAPRLLVIEEPTRGVDVKTKRDIYSLLRRYAAGGHAVIAFCTEPSEAFELADEVRVVHRGVLSESIDIRAIDHVETLAAQVALRTRSMQDSSLGLAGIA